MAARTKPAAPARRPARSDVTLLEKSERACIAVKTWTLRDEVKSLDDKFLLHLFDMLLEELLRPFNADDRKEILATLERCSKSGR
jgi:hypothetical protein